ncbi:response regulator transcription factor [Dyadobacter diqingensis]|uniref:response regulator transcription factor n=1 Tax=Dyadobacter diqingensis TaxID=2938121 RepID=UPI0020C44ED0|nr:response regulator transcription factor [Dyadobacter diqingensis]
MREILIVEDHPIVSMAVEMTLRENFPEFSVLKADTFYNALDIVSQIGLNLIILDIGIPGGGTASMIKNLRLKQRGVPILIFSGLDEKTHAVSYIHAGANGFVSKNASEHEVITAVDTVLSNRKYFSSDLWELVVSGLPTPGVTNPVEMLTKRETEIMDMLIMGKWTKEIALELHVKDTTVSTHKQNIFRKFDVTNIVELVKKKSNFARKY